MELTPLKAGIAISEIISVLLIFGLWRSKEYLILKIIITMLTAIPFVGPVLYMFITDKTPVEKKEIQNRGQYGWGGYARWWRSEKPFLKMKIQKLKESDEKKNDK